MNISSVVLRSNPKKLAAVRAALAAMPGVEIHADANNGRFVLTLESTPEATADVLFAQLEAIDGVVNTSLVYHYCDDAHSEESE
ncbi:MAG: chaperone NapD [Burkholderiales bacterium]